jgi:hypothetical protein
VRFAVFSIGARTPGFSGRLAFLVGEGPAGAGGFEFEISEVERHGCIVTRTGRARPCRIGERSGLYKAIRRNDCAASCGGEPNYTAACKCGHSGSTNLAHRPARSGHERYVT